MQTIDRMENRTADFTFCVCSYNSARTISACLRSIREIAPYSEILVVDHRSQDDTVDIARSFGARVIFESIGLGHARQLCFDNVSTEYVVFVDSDVEIIRKDFLQGVSRFLEQPNLGAVVGVSASHKFAYGLPASLLALRKKDFGGLIIPDYIDARETFFIQRRLDNLQLKTAYVPDSIVHRSNYRRYKPEWEGANTRKLPSPTSKELIFTSKVILLLALNSRSIKNLTYLPIFYAKFLRGFLNPEPWTKLKRIDEG